MSDFPDDLFEDRETSLSFRDRLEQLKCAAFLLTHRRPSERQTTEAFCECISAPFETMAGIYGYSFSLDQPITALIQKGSQTTLVMSLQNKHQENDLRIVDIFINNLCMTCEIIMVGREYGDTAGFVLNGPLHYRLRQKDMAKEIVAIAETAMMNFLQDDLDEQIEAVRSGDQARVNVRALDKTA